MRALICLLALVVILLVRGGPVVADPCPMHGEGPAAPLHHAQAALAAVTSASAVSSGPVELVAPDESGPNPASLPAPGGGCCHVLSGFVAVLADEAVGRVPSGRAALPEPEPPARMLRVFDIFRPPALG